MQAGIKQKPNESAEDFQLRKGALEHHLAEMERFVSESAELSLGWITDSSKRIATLDLDLTAIASEPQPTTIGALGCLPGDVIALSADSVVRYFEVSP